MANNTESKPTRLPYPPAQVGVPSYPTPYRNFILLTEKVSTEKGDYTPLYPDKETLYTGIDADKYPPLYFVSQKANEDGRWIIRYWSTDRDWRRQNSWNYTLTPFGDDTAFPMYVRTYIVPRDTFIPATDLQSISQIFDIHVLAGGTGYAEGDTVVFDSSTDATAKLKIENGVIVGAYITNYGTYASESTAASIVSSTGSGGVLKVLRQPNNCLMIKETKYELDAQDPLAGRYIRVEQTYLTLPTAWVIETSWKEYGFLITQKSRINVSANITELEAIDGSGNVTSVTRKPYQNFSNIAYEVFTAYQVPSDTLSEFQTDPISGIVIQIKKTIVPVVEATEANSGNVGGWWTDFSPIDVLTSLKIESMVVSQLPISFTWYETRPLSLPPTLVNITPVTDATSSTGAGTGSGIESEVNANTSSEISGDFLITSTSGFSGEAKCQVVRTYSLSPPTLSTLPSPTIITRSSGTGIIISKGGGNNVQIRARDDSSAAGWSLSNSFEGSTKMATRITRFDGYLTGGVVSGSGTIAGDSPTADSVGTTDAGAELVVNAASTSSLTWQIALPTSTPSSFSSGETITGEVKVQQWKLGIWVTDVVTIYVP